MGWFIKEDKPPDKVSPETAVRRSPRPSSAPPTRPAATRVINYLGDGPVMSQPVVSVRKSDNEPDPRFDQQIRESFRSVDQPGYMELIDQIEVLADAIPDSSTRLRAALKSVEKAHGIPPAQVAASLRAHINILNRERTGFHEAIDEQARIKVSSSQDSIRQCEGDIARIRADIQKLEEEASRLEGQKETLARQVSEVEGMKAAVVQKFESAFTYHQDRLEGIRTQLETLGVSSR